MQLGNTAHDGQSESVAFAAHLASAEEALAQASQRLCGDTGTVVENREVQAMFIGAQDNLNQRLIRRVADSVVDQVAQRHLQQFWIAGNRRQRLI